jgi:hypothetical protein
MIPHANLNVRLASTGIQSHMSQYLIDDRAPERELCQNMAAGKRGTGVGVLLENVTDGRVADLFPLLIRLTPHFQ